MKKDNFSSRIRAHPYSGWGNGYNDSNNINLKEEDFRGERFAHIPGQLKGK